MDGILSIKYNNVNITLANNLSIVFGPNLTWPTDQQVSKPAFYVLDILAFIPGPDPPTA
jgi:hypothetical protein